MKLCRFQNKHGQVGIGMVVEPDVVVDLTAAGVAQMQPLLENPRMPERLKELSALDLPRFAFREIKLLCPIERQEIWAAGVTYLRSKKARMEESDFSATAYDRVYEADRPEIFFKSLPEKAVAPFESVGIRQDARWNVPEPELVLILNSSGNVVGFSIGNDMSSRDIEGENLLYLPQAKIYDRSCAIGPWIVVEASETEARSWNIQLEIEREGKLVMQGQTSAGQIKRSFAELSGYLFRSQKFPHGAALLTGTGVIPPDQFTLRPNDRVRIHISGIGTLENPVTEV
jgi:2-dehydro-3-deoxy-D-arabinonate dehydratase